MMGYIAATCTSNQPPAPSMLNDFEAWFAWCRDKYDQPVCYKWVMSMQYVTGNEATTTWA